MKNVSLNLCPGSLTMVVGPVGSGKSSLLKTLLGQLHITEGSARKNGKIAYFPQESFLLNDLLKNNIIFGNEFNREKYQRIISLCELDLDIASLKAGDLTEIGESGINLSGGQKQRISIARGLYNDADIFLIDDAFSALDPHVGANIFNNVVVKELLAQGKTVLLVTHVLSFLDQADTVVFLQEGGIQAKGSFSSLISESPEFKLFVQTKDNRTSSNAVSSKFDYNPAVFDEIQMQNGNNPSLPPSEKKIKTLESAKNTDFHIAQGKLMKKERKETGSVKSTVFLNYFTSGGVCFFIFIMLLFVLMVVSNITSDYWISVWTSDLFGFEESTYIKIYSGILAFMLLINFVKSIFFGWYVVKIGLQLFKSLLWRIITKPMNFFDTTPIGQLLNLTTKDSDDVDTFLAGYVGSTMDGLIRLFGILILAGSANFFLIPIIIGKILFCLGNISF